MAPKTGGLPVHDIFVGPAIVHATATADGIYYTRGGKAVRHFKQPAEDWLASTFCKDIREIRIFAMPENSALIAAAAGASFRVLLASPLMLDTRRARHNPNRILNRAMDLTSLQIRISGHRGGWHYMQTDEDMFYRAAAALAAGASDATIVALLERHPIWQRITFMSPCDEVLLAKLLATLRDPRWYVDVTRPGSLAKLYTFMGLAMDLRLTQGPTNRDMAISTWRTSEATPQGVTRHPRGFLWRHFCKSDDGQLKRERKTTRLMLRFIRSIWLDYIAAVDGYAGIVEPLFIPEYWMDDALKQQRGNTVVKDPMAAEIAWAYREYVAGRALPTGSSI